MTSAPDEDNVYPSTPHIDEEEFDLANLLGVVLEGRWIIAIVTALSVFVGVFLAFTAPPVYRTDALLQVEPEKPALSNLDAAALLEDYASANAEIQILKSRSVLGTVVDNLQLDIDARPKYIPLIGAALARRQALADRPLITVDTLDLPDSMRGRRLKLVAGESGEYALYDDSDVMLLRGQVGKVATQELANPGRMMLFVSKLQAQLGQVFWIERGFPHNRTMDLKRNLSVVEQGERSNILEISLEGENPVSIAEQLNDIANVYVRQNVERNSAQAAKTLDFLDGQLPVVQSDVEVAELALNSYRLEKGSIDLPAETQGVLEAIVRVEAQLNELRQEREKVRLAFTEIHPTIIAVDRQLARLNAELSALNERVRDLPTTQQDLLRLLRDVEVNTVLYTALLDTAQELRVVKAGTIGNVRVIDYAYAPTLAISPNRSQMVLLALLLGVFLGVALVFVRKALNAGVEDPDLLEKQLNIPVYATVTHSQRQDKIYKDMNSAESEPAILAVDSPDDPAIESLRNLQTALHFGMMNVENNRVMISGPSPSVGKSFISVNLAAVLASSDKKVLLIDGDLRRGRLHSYLGLERKNGLSDFVSGDITLDEALYQTSIPRLTLIPTGTLPPNPTEMLLHQRFADLLDVLAPKYDHVIIDTPPILVAADAAIIGQLVAGTLLILKSAQHPMREIDVAVKRLRQAEVNLRGLLLNDVAIHSRRYGYDYGADKYHYQYAYTKD